ncbi:MAG: hypothetical protein JW778_00110 [Candidatus Altiarchaeota archaeon]|nr:hypothetical protein [Candidatus Altiarchaeota archaeon]
MAIVLGFGSLLMLCLELIQVGEGYLFLGYNIVLAIIGCIYFITAIKIFGIIQGGVS